MASDNTNAFRKQFGPTEASQRAMVVTGIEYNATFPGNEPHVSLKGSHLTATIGQPSMPPSKRSVTFVDMSIDKANESAKVKKEPVGGLCPGNENDYLELFLNPDDPKEGALVDSIAFHTEDGSPTPPPKSPARYNQSKVLQKNAGSDYPQCSSTSRGSREMIDRQKLIWRAQSFDKFLEAHHVTTWEQDDAERIPKSNADRSLAALSRSLTRFRKLGKRLKGKVGEGSEKQ
ncbi:hypothetical protein P154DRAFT_611724 [Amniculicola lignicola CBS 123094]|uniref:Uncharacterized protein n=1 Tax=Amniculicola lignicola CBS 123094 TaxID=1392246 RepID=A0A6A5WYD3_9PLEO|nr:hypothetical protein P154DRAFT_611724 [Amniculicola lignicola CBS 123094]